MSPFSMGYTRKTQEITFGVAPAVDGPTVFPAAESESDLERFSGTPIMNRNLLTMGDLGFHLIVPEGLNLEFFFSTGAGSTGSIITQIPKAEAIVEWVGRLIPKTVFDAVTKAIR